jgi:hypothetical protein
VCLSQCPGGKGGKNLIFAKITTSDSTWYVLPFCLNYITKNIDGECCSYIFKFLWSFYTYSNFLTLQIIKVEIEARKVMMIKLWILWRRTDLSDTEHGDIAISVRDSEHCVSDDGWIDWVLKAATWRVM